MLASARDWAASALDEGALDAVGFRNKKDCEIGISATRRVSIRGVHEESLLLLLLLLAPIFIF